MTENYQKQLDGILENLSYTPRLLLHACCAPCSSYVLECLTNYFDITLYFYNPNIETIEEYNKRYSELKRLISQMPLKNSVALLPPEYDSSEFLTVARGLENEPERGARCVKCFDLRLSKTAALARDGNFDYFTTTLSISPHKNAELLNKIGEKYAGEFNVAHLPADFKKRGGYLRSIELSREYNLYRQSFCGCGFSK